VTTRQVTLARGHHRGRPRTRPPPAQQPAYSPARRAAGTQALQDQPGGRQMSTNIQAVKEKWLDIDPDNYLETNYRWRDQTGPVVVDEDGNAFILKEITFVESLEERDYSELKAWGLRLKKNGQVAERQGVITSTIYLSLDDRIA